MSDKVQQMLRHLVELNRTLIFNRGRSYEIKEVRMGTLSVIKNDIGQLSQMRVTLTDEEVLTELATEFILQIIEVTLIND